ncbi:MAG: hypothetical protein LBC96_02085 [Lachnospiraceae bacterium]|jgi:hypothetical protein|nr:hypothetical protein [Lachnospiraceae bacterium]
MHLQNNPDTFSGHFKKTFLLLFLLMCLVFSGCTGCGPSIYYGDYPELYSIVISSVISADGYGEHYVSREITILDEDDFGRKLFSYREVPSRLQGSSLHISQASDEQFAYFYPHFNFILSSTDEFDEEEVLELRRRNDWGKEIDLSQCVKVRITDHKGNGPLTQDETRRFHEWIQGDIAIVRPTIIYFISDMYGRSLYLGLGKERARFDKEGNMSIQKIDAMMMFNPNGSYNRDTGWFELDDMWNYQEKLKQFMEMNNWNQPLP